MAGVRGAARGCLACRLSTHRPSSHMWECGPQERAHAASCAPQSCPVPGCHRWELWGLGWWRAGRLEQRLRRLSVRLPARLPARNGIEPCVLRLEQQLRFGAQVSTLSLWILPKTHYSNTNTLGVILTLICIVKRATCAYSTILCGRGFTRSHEECGCRTAPKR